MTSWLLMPPWGMRAAALVGLVLVALSVARMVRERQTVPIRRQAAPFVMRLLAVAFLLFVALNPTALLPRVTSARPSMIVLIDTSYSMSTGDVEGESRLAAALGALRDDGALERLEGEFAPVVRRFDGTSREADLRALDLVDADGDASDLGLALTEAVSDQGELESHAGVLVVSDGRATGPGAEDAARLALARSVPVWTWCLGGEVPRRDLWIETPSAEMLAFAGSDVQLAATLRQTGYVGRSFRVEVLKGTEVIDARDVLPDASGRARVETTVRAPATGEERVVFRAVPEGDEADTSNNERAVFVRTVGEKVRVLVVEGEPHWDTKFLVQCLKRDERVELTAVYRLGPKRFFAIVSALGDERREERDLFPRTPEEMMRYDVVMLGRGCESFFDEKTERLLTEFVAERGGGLVFSRGKAYGGRFAPLAKLEPVAWSDRTSFDLKLAPTAAGRDSPVLELAASDDIDDLIERLPSFDQARVTTGEKPLAVVLAEAGAGGPGARTIVMAYHRYGQGKVLTVNGSGLWRWAFRDRGKDEDELVYGRFWIAVLRWMIAASDILPGANVALRSERRYYTDEQPMRFLISTRGLETGAYRPRLVIESMSESGDSVAASSRQPDTALGSGPLRSTSRAEIDPRQNRGGGYVAEAGPFPPGTYEVTLHNNVGVPEKLSLALEVVSSSVEKRILSADPGLMKRLAETSGGRALSREDVLDMPGVVERWRASRQRSVDRRTIWDEGWILALLLGIMGAEWYLRRREGLL